MRVPRRHTPAAPPDPAPSLPLSQAEQAELAQQALNDRSGSSSFKKALAAIDKSVGAAERHNQLHGNVLVGAADASFFQRIRQPKSLCGTLRDYQLQGFRWLAEKVYLGESAIVADEMGLGKTIQVIAMLAYMWERKTIGPVLIIGPLSVVGNWEAEFKRFLPAVGTLKYRGTADER